MTNILSVSTTIIVTPVRVVFMSGYIICEIE